jgi:hypothetical protein
VRLVSGKATHPSKADAVVLWEKQALLSPGVLVRLPKTHLADPSYYSAIEAAVLRALYARTLEPETTQRLLDRSRANYKALLKRVSGCRRSFVFGTGPSLERAPEFDFDGGFNVVCNSIVKNKALLEHIKPQLLVFGDPVFHFSPCRYSAEFRRAVLETVELFDCHVIVQDFSLPLCLAHYPQLEGRIIGLPVWGREYNFPTLDRFHVRPAQNVMTRCMLPVASSVAEEVFIIGADGRRPDEKYFWTHSSAAQFDDLMQTAVDTHPSFFRDTVYTDYYESHCRMLEDLFQYGEAMGKSYYALTPSYIPALSRRPAPRRS